LYNLQKILSLIYLILSIEKSLFSQKLKSQDMIKNTDLERLKEKGISKDDIETQIKRFKEGFPPLKVERPATLADGIVPFSEQALDSYKKIYQKELMNGLRPLKFVPASGAATRMFKALYLYLEKAGDIKHLENDHPVIQFIDKLPKFAFFNELNQYFKNRNLKNKEIRRSLASEIIGKILNANGLNYSFLPKGLILFHQYPSGARTAMMEHLSEAACYAKDKSGESLIHFTVSPEHIAYFKKELNDNQTATETKTGTVFNISFSFQKPHTDTIAVLPNNEPYRDENGNISFRPGGHGSLIENLNDCNADIIFIKNIDNVVPEYKLPFIADYKKALGGFALEIKNKGFCFIRQLKSALSPNLILQIRNFLQETLHTDIPEYLEDASIEEQGSYLLQYFDRPIRVCGMVKNEGEPGGGPFWVRNKKGQETLQIVESSQIDHKNPEQEKRFEASTHFNPVDLVCITKNYEGNKFDLLKYIDHETGFISEKSMNGKMIRAFERPGLWNGAMAHWLSIFVEVPLDTFNPVKTVNDLLRKEHQPK
jgi:hypothetical protein